ncbi:MAG TPA: hypothetical protein VFI25_13210 [Planctomycetota bacterium]|jgi:hypothetical protein|nr:hypothetical protein [Planctomycetota bacterium]
MRRLGGYGALALYFLAFLGAPAAHEVAGADPRHVGADPHEPRVGAFDMGGAPALHLPDACSICRWHSANSGAFPVRPLLVARPLESEPLLSPPSEAAVPGPGLPLPGARAPPAA